jgi:CRP-like cAMP-binding protein
MKRAGAMKNRLLSLLPAAEYEQLRPALDHVELAMRDVLYEGGDQIQYVYFPESAIISLLAITPEGQAVETATIGREGFVGLPAYLGSSTSHAQAVVQAPGSAQRMEAHALREHVGRTNVLKLLMGLYTSTFLAQQAQSTACHRLHPLEQRCARWLLMIHDGREGDSFPMTHEFLSYMLGVTRPTVSIVTGMLQRAGLISYRHGTLTVEDRAGLEEAACGCYKAIRHLYDNLTPEGLARASSHV